MTQTQAYETAFPKTEDGKDIPWEIEGIEVSQAHLDREIAVIEPTSHAWTGILSGWEERGILVRKPGSPEVQVIHPLLLRWVM